MLHVSVTLTNRSKNIVYYYSRTEKEKSSMYIISFSLKNEKRFYIENFFLILQFFPVYFCFYKMCGCPTLNTHNVSVSICNHLFIKIIVIFIR